MCSFYFYDVYGRQDYFLTFTQKLHLFSDIQFCRDIVMEMVSDDFLTNIFGSTWSRVTNRIADTSTERACQSKWWYKRMETKKIFLIIFNTPFLPVDMTKMTYSYLM